MKSKKCKHKGCENPVWSDGHCMKHIAKKALNKRGITFYSNRIGVKNFDKAISLITKIKPYSDKQEQIRKRYDLFQMILNKRGKFSEVSGEKLYGEISSAWFHHIIPKGKFPLGDLDENNIIILTMDEHADVENDMFKFEEINRRRELLLKKYNLI